MDTDIDDPVVEVVEFGETFHFEGGLYAVAGFIASDPTKCAIGLVDAPTEIMGVPVWHVGRHGCVGVDLVAAVRARQHWEKFGHPKLVPLEL